jgi:hypothetical protein
MDTRLHAECIQEKTQNDNGCSSKRILQRKPKIFFLELQTMKIDVAGGVTCLSAWMISKSKCCGKLDIKAGDEVRT